MNDRAKSTETVTGLSLEQKLNLKNTLDTLSFSTSKNNRREITITAKSKIQTIYDQMKTLISSFLMIRRFPYKNKKEHLELINKLTNVAVCMCLDIWLENDKGSQQNISAFLTYNRYLSHKEKLALNSKTAIEPEKTKVARDASYQLRQIIALQNEKAKKLGKKYKRMPYKSHRYKINYDYVSLRFINLISQPRSIWDFIDLLFYDQKGNNNENPTAHKLPLDRLALAYTTYDSLLKEIKGMNNERNYVVACLQLRKFEQAYRFYFFGKIAKYMVDNSIPKEYSLPISLMVFYQNYIPNEDAYCKKETSSPLWLLEDSYLKHSFQYMKVKKEMWFAYEHVKAANCIINDTVSLYYELYPVKKMESWSNKDFEDATEFFKKKYKIDRSLVPLNLGKYNNSNKAYFEYLEYLYTCTENISQEDWEYAKKSMTTH